MEREGNLIRFSPEEQWAGEIEKAEIEAAEAPELCQRLDNHFSELNAQYQKLAASTDYRTAFIGSRRLRLAGMNELLGSLNNILHELHELAEPEIAAAKIDSYLEDMDIPGIDLDRLYEK